MIERVKIFTIRIVYKSGYTHDFDCTKFDKVGGSYSWDGEDAGNRPLILGVDDISAVWVVGERKEWKWK